MRIKSFEKETEPGQDKMVRNGRLAFGRTELQSNQIIVHNESNNLLGSIR